MSTLGDGGWSGVVGGECVSGESTDLHVSRCVCARVSQEDVCRVSSGTELPVENWGPGSRLLQGFSRVASFSSWREMEGEGRRRAYIKPGIPATAFCGQEAFSLRTDTPGRGMSGIDDSFPKGLPSSPLPWSRASPRPCQWLMKSFLVGCDKHFLKKYMRLK